MKTTGETVYYFIILDRNCVAKQNFKFAKLCEIN